MAKKDLRLLCSLVYGLGAVVIISRDSVECLLQKGVVFCLFVKTEWQLNWFMMLVNVIFSMILQHGGIVDDRAM